MTDTLDCNTVTVTLSPPTVVPADRVQEIVARQEGRPITAEGLAVVIAGEIREASVVPLATPITVTVRQEQGHGVEAEATA